MFCDHILESDKYIGIHAEHIFTGLIHKLKNYYYYNRTTREILNFLPFLEDLIKIYTDSGFSELIELPPECNYMLFENGFISNSPDLINV